MSQLTVPWSKTDFRVIIGKTRIDYDPTKESINRKKHGYSLESATYLLERLILPVPSPLFITTDSFEYRGEIRHNHMTLDDEKHLVFFATTMRNDEVVRVISLRRASDKEEKIYRAEAIKITANGL
jgi:uncharacterized DUF497 family protein